MPAATQRERLLAAAAEDERVAALEPHRLEALAAERDEQLVELGLAEPLARDRAARRAGASSTSSGATSTS